MRRRGSLWRIIAVLVVLKIIFNTIGIGALSLITFNLHHMIRMWVNGGINVIGILIIIAIFAGRKRGKERSSDDFDFDLTKNNYNDNYGERYTKPDKRDGKKDYGNYNGENYNTPMYSKTRRDIMFSDRKVVATGSEGAFNVAFASGRIDLTALPAPDTNRRLKINVMFSDSKIKIDEDIPMVISVKSVFSDAKLPNNDNISFGQDYYKTRSYMEGKPHFYVEMNTIFSSSRIIDKTK